MQTSARSPRGARSCWCVVGATLGVLVAWPAAASAQTLPHAAAATVLSCHTYPQYSGRFKIGGEAGDCVGFDAWRVIVVCHDGIDNVNYTVRGPYVSRGFSHALCSDPAAPSQRLVVSNISYQGV